MALTAIHKEEDIFEVKGKAPTLESLKSTKSEADIYYRQFHNQCNEEEDYYYGRNPIPVPVDMAVDPVRPATARAIINVATDHVDVSNPTFAVPEPSPRAKDRAERLKKFYQGVWMHVPKAVLNTGAKHEIAYGLGWLKVTFDADLWPNAPQMKDFPSEKEYRESLSKFMEERNISFPIRVDNVNPKYMTWDDSRLGPRWAFECYETTVRDIRHRFPEWMPAKEANSAATWSEFWSETHVAYMADGDFVLPPMEHNYGFLPYVPIIPATSLDFNSGRPEQRYQGILKPVHNLLDTEARLITQYEAILRQYAWRTVDFHGNRQEAENVKDAYELFGSKNIVTRGVTVMPSPLITPPQEILNQLSMVQTMIEEATFPNVVRGIRPSGVSTGFGISVLSGMGRLVFGPYADGLARAMEECNKRFAMLVENKIRGRITVRARSEVHSFDQSISPDDIKGFYENRVFLKAEAPEERERESILAERLWKSGIISLYEAQKRSGITNPLEEQNQMAAERILEALMPQQVEEAARRLDLPAQLGAAADVPEGMNTGNQFAPGLSQLQRPAEANLQQARVASNEGRESVFPQGIGGIDLLGNQLASATGGGRRMPSGQRVP